MSTTLCRGCGQPLGASQEVCLNCGIRNVLRGAGTPEPATVTLPAAAASAVLESPPTPVAPMPEATAPMYPYEERFASPARNTQGRKIALTLALAILLGFVARAGLGALAHRSDPGDLVAQVPVNANGGKATFGEGGKIEVPKGAVDKPRTINVYRRTIDRRVQVAPPSGGTALIFPPGTLVVYTFGPTNLAFLRPILIVLPVPPGQNGIVFLTQNGQIQFLPGTPTTGTVTVLVTSFNLNTPGAITVARA